MSSLAIQWISLFLLAAFISTAIGNISHHHNHHHHQSLSQSKSDSSSAAKPDVDQSSLQKYLDDIVHMTSIGHSLARVVKIQEDGLILISEKALESAGSNADTLRSMFRSSNTLPSPDEIVEVTKRVLNDMQNLMSQRSDKLEEARNSGDHHMERDINRGLENLGYAHEALEKIVFDIERTEKQQQNSIVPSGGHHRHHHSTHGNGHHKHHGHHHNHNQNYQTQQDNTHHHHNSGGYTQGSDPEYKVNIDLNYINPVRDFDRSTNPHANPNNFNTNHKETIHHSRHWHRNTDTNGYVRTSNRQRYHQKNRVNSSSNNSDEKRMVNHGGMHRYP